MIGESLVLVAERGAMPLNIEQLGPQRVGSTSRSASSLVARHARAGNKTINAFKTTVPSSRSTATRAPTTQRSSTRAIS
jgi:hypothetical protein